MKQTISAVSAYSAVNGLAASELQTRNFLIRRHDLVPHLHHELKGEVGLFHCDHGAMQVGSVAVQQFRDLALGFALRALDLVHGLLKRFHELAAFGRAWSA